MASLTKVFAVLLVALCVLPNTAPFASVTFAPIQHQHSPEIDAASLTVSDESNAAHPDDDDNDAITAEHSTCRRDSHTYAYSVALSATTASLPFVPHVAAITATVSSPPLSIALRL